MTSYIATLLDTETFEVVTTIVVETETLVEAFVEAERQATEDGLCLGDLFLR